MNQQPLFRHRVKPDTNHILHIEVPPAMGQQFDVLIIPTPTTADLPPESVELMHLFEETAFARDVLNNPEEDCWNGL